jgi:hypothetical protein
MGLMVCYDLSRDFAPKTCVQRAHASDASGSKKSQVGPSETRQKTKPKATDEHRVFPEPAPSSMLSRTLPNGLYDAPKASSRSMNSHQRNS